MHAAWSIAAAGASVPRPAAVAPRVAPRVVKAADLLSFERQGYWLDRGLLDKAQVQALAPALGRALALNNNSSLSSHRPINLSHFMDTLILRSAFNNLKTIHHNNTQMSCMQIWYCSTLSQ